MKQNKLIKSLTQHPLAYLLLFIFTIIFAYPILWAFFSSLKTSAEIKQSPYSLPLVPQFVNYKNAWVGAHMGDYFVNSVLVTTLSMILLIAMVIPTSYVLSRFEFKGRKLLNIIMMAGLFINVNYIVYPIYLMINDVGKAAFGNGLLLTDNRVTVAIINAVTSVPFSIYLLSGFLKGLPKGYEEAAKIDGCGNWRILGSIIIPLARPSILTVILFQFLAYWNEYLVAQTFLITAAKRTLPVGLLSIMQEARTATDYGRMYAGLVIVMLPVLILYCFVQKNLTKGISMGGLKG
ncbi:MAG: carbohydrate ABC transporter permease [Spirochaetales bacterium]|nr:carbohydrate ABC transporter permease [Spirochaetales bacterium]